MNKEKNCRFCGSENSKYLFSSFNVHGRKVVDKNEKFDWRKCLDCHSIFLSGLEINDEYYKKYYQTDYYGDEKNIGLAVRLWKLINKFILKRREKDILSHFKDRKRKISILDIGCGDGGFLSILNSEIFEKSGTEVNPEGIKRSKEKGIQVYDKDLQFIDFGEKKFDVVTLWHVLEHLENPSLTFEKAKEILSDNGILMLQVPNNESLGFRFGRKFWFHLDSPRHLAIPSAKTIKKIGRKTGFGIIETKNEWLNYPLDLFWSVRYSPIKFVIYPLYPLFKALSREHLTFVLKRDNINRI